MIRRVISVFWLLWLLLPVASNAVVFGYTGSHLPASQACQSYHTVENAYYCQLVIRTSKASVSTTNAGTIQTIGYYELRTPANTAIHHFHFGHPTTANPSTFTCPPNGGSNYSPTTGLCSAYTGSPQFCAFSPGFTCGQNCALSTYVAGRGCVYDQDNDGLLSHLDNCPGILNPNQEDTDIDGIGDACDVCAPQTPSITYAVFGHAVSTALPQSLCDGNLCAHQLTISGCTAGQCEIAFNANGQQCPQAQTFNIADYILQAPSTYGYNLAADNAAITITSGLSAHQGIHQGQKFSVTNCQRTVAGSAPSQSLLSQNYWDGSIPCSNFLQTNTCLTTSEIDSYIQTYLRTEPITKFDQVNGTVSQYPYYTDVKVSPIGADLKRDQNFGYDDGNGSYSATVIVQSQLKRFDTSVTSPYSVQPYGTFYPMRFNLQGCTGGGSGGSGGGDLGGNYEDLSESIDSAKDETTSFIDDIIEKAENAGDDFDTSVDDILANENGDKYPGFFDIFEDLFEEPRQECPVLSTNFLGHEFNLMAQFCAKWEEYGRPILGYIIYWLTLIAIRDLWLDSSPKPK